MPTAPLAAESMSSTLNPPDSITCIELRELMETVFTEPQRRVLIFDVRPKRDYDRCHMFLDSLFSRRRPKTQMVNENAVVPGTERRRIRVINVDVMQIKPATISKIKPLIKDEDDLRVFERRDCASDVVIVAPKESSTMPEEARHMIEALTKWDTTSNKITVKPKLLSGGFIDWHYRYPQLTTEPREDPEPIEPLSFKRPAVGQPTTTPESVILASQLDPVPSKPSLAAHDLRKRDDTTTALPMITPESHVKPEPVPKVAVPSVPRVSEIVTPKLVTVQQPTIGPIIQPPVKEKSYVPVPPKQPKPAIHSSSLAPANGSLSRSHSSPNVAQENGDELSALSLANAAGQQPSSTMAPTNRPTFNRAHKPINNVSHSARDTETLRYLVSQLNFEPLSHGTVGQSMTGLKNLGNTCFMNSVIQCLAYAPQISYYFGQVCYLDHVNFNSQYGSKGELAIQFGALIEQLNNHQYRSLTPKSFREAVVRHIGFAGCDQQDSHEFMMMLFDKLHHDLNVHSSKAAAHALKEKAKQQQQQRDKINNSAICQVNGLPAKAPTGTQLNGDCTTASSIDSSSTSSSTAEMGFQFWKHHVELNRSIISETFEGIFMSTLTCTVCDTQSSTFELFNCLSLPIPNETRCSLQECLAHFSKPERIEAAWECSRCKVKRDAVKKIVICKLPRMLIVHLKRFSQDGPWRQKLQTTVDFPLENLNVDYVSSLPTSAYVSNSNNGSNNGNSNHLRHGAGGQSSAKSHRYDLYAVVNHYGTLDGGHYTAFCHIFDRHRWFTFDDNEVSEVNKNDVCTKSAYILFYTTCQPYTCM